MKIERGIKTCVLFGILIIAALLLSACLPWPPPPQPPVSEEIPTCVWPDMPERAAPTWICDQPYKNYRFTAVGSHDSRNKTLAKNAAIADARNNLASAMRTYVKRMVRSYVERTGSGDNETIDDVASDTSKHITVEKLYGTRPVGSLTSPKGTVYVVVAQEEPDTLKAVSDAFRTSYRDKKAEWQRIMRDKSEEEMDREIRDLIEKDTEVVTPRSQR